MAFDPYKVDLLLLSHSHIDHTGRVSQLDKHGAEESIHCSIYNLSIRNSLKIFGLGDVIISEKGQEFDLKKS